MADVILVDQKDRETGREEKQAAHVRGLSLIHILISCGLGVQTVADLAGKPVYAAANSLNYRGYHGMALTERKCDACAQCYLNVTGGICPVVDCSKSLINGQCGGAKNGKCEVDGNKDLSLIHISAG